MKTQETMIVKVLAAFKELTEQSGIFLGESTGTTWGGFYLSLGGHVDFSGGRH